MPQKSRFIDVRMNLKSKNAGELVVELKLLVCKEREITTQILHPELSKLSTLGPPLSEV